MKPIFASLIFMIMLAGCGAHFGESRALTPRGSAAAQLTAQGNDLLNAGKPDSAIRLYEQALGLDPTNGQVYYHMAQAWLAKGRPDEARKYNDLAREYFENDPLWAARVNRQAEQIARLKTN